MPEHETGSRIGRNARTWLDWIRFALGSCAIHQCLTREMWLYIQCEHYGLTKLLDIVLQLCIDGLCLPYKVISILLFELEGYSFPIHIRTFPIWLIWRTDSSPIYIRIFPICLTTKIWDPRSHAVCCLPLHSPEVLRPSSASNLIFQNCTSRSSSAGSGSTITCIRGI